MELGDAVDLQQCAEYMMLRTGGLDCHPATGGDLFEDGEAHRSR
jgi:hypothetical protein